VKLGATPPANQLASTKDSARSMERFPLEVLICKECKHIQLRDIVDPEILFSEYIYKSGTSQTFVNHFAELARTIHSLENPNNFVLEVGSNDGTLLEALSSAGFKSVGVEPSKILVSESNKSGRETIEGYFDSVTMSQITSEFGKPGVIVGNNVFAHIDDLNAAFECAAEFLHEDGHFIFEVAEASKILTTGIFDTIYHEHMSYHSVIAMQKFSSKHGFVIHDVQKISTHGGSLRVFLRKNKYKENTHLVDNFIAEEQILGLDDESALEKIDQHIKRIKSESQELFSNFLDIPGVKLFGYGAPAKVVTFLAALDLENLPIVGIVDDNEHKQGKFLPGSGIGIVSSQEMQNTVASDASISELVCLIFPWNLGPEVSTKLKTWMPSGSSIITFFPSIKKVVV
jgi:2-polyprenyl-3-methyl-5-hydroxy-6-metoxy-1,4-benzoquinol methylase